MRYRICAVSAGSALQNAPTAQSASRTSWTIPYRRFLPKSPMQKSPEASLYWGCQRSAGRLAPSVQMPDHFRFLAVPCAGAVSENAIWKLLAARARGVLVVGCHHGNCASDTGTDRAAARVQRGQSTGLFGVGFPRLGYVTVAPNEPARFERLLKDFAGDEEDTSQGKGVL